MAEKPTNPDPQDHPPEHPETPETQDAREASASEEAVVSPASGEPGVGDHDAGDEDHPVDFDPAQQSLADALRVSFALLTVIMVVLVVMYIFSGVFTVREQQQAVVLRFGEIAGEPGNQVLDAGGPYFTWPYPISSVEFIDISQRQISLDQSFMYQVEQQDATRTADELAERSGPLNPELDGSLITGDENIVHARFQIAYRVTDPVALLSHVGLAAYGEPMGNEQLVSNEADRMVRIERLLRVVADQVIVEMAAKIKADDVISKQVDAARAEARQRMQQILDELGAGVTVTDFIMTESEMPLSVRQAYRAVINAQSERSQRIDQARKQQTEILGEVAGAAAQPLPGGKPGPLVAMIQQYQQAVELGEDEQATRLRDAIDDAFDQRAITQNNISYPIGGQAAQSINEANTYRTLVVERVKGDSERFTSLLERFRDNPQLLLQRRWQEARGQILSGDVETMYVRPGSHVRLDLTGDPEVARAREEKRMQQAQEERQRNSQ